MYIGLDLGTSSLKAILVDGGERLLAEHSVPLTVQRPHDGWSEQDPREWERAAVTALRALSSQHDCSQVAAIGLSGHMHGATLVGANDQPLRPCMLWNDTRSHAQAAAMDANPVFRRVTGNIVFPGFTAPKVDWVRQNEPALFDQLATVLLPKDYLRLFLTGEKLSDMSDAAGTSWLDTGARDWSDALLASCHLSRDHMPGLVEGAAPAGRLRQELAADLGLPRCIIAGGAGDNAAAAVGTGVVCDGQAFLSLGTSGVLFAANDRYRPDPATAVHSFCHAIPDTWHQMGVILAATDALEWLARLTGRSARALTEGLGPVDGPARPLFLPYLGGERTPHNDARIRGQFLHLDHATDTDEATRAVLQGVAFAFGDCRDALAATGTQIDRALVVGGGAASDHWVQTLASVLGITLERPVRGAYGAALGAARLARMAATGEGPEIATSPAIARSFDADPRQADAWAAAHQRYKEAYNALK